MSSLTMNHEAHEDREGYSFDPLSHTVIGAAIEVHRELGPGLLESSYRRCLVHELGLRGIEVLAEVPLPIVYKGLSLDCGYRMDIVVENTLLLELKSVQAIENVHVAQTLTYQKLSKLPTALLINFNVPVLKEGIRRFVR